ncbi:hypothetical protein GQX74_008127 [Glossina fuscipes]|nr:hypothetical protein GQX74_008127 [Glossina fuscipes]
MRNHFKDTEFKRIFDKALSWKPFGLRVELVYNSSCILFSVESDEFPKEFLVGVFETIRDKQNVDRLSRVAGKLCKTGISNGGNDAFVNVRALAEFTLTPAMSPIMDIL